MLVVALCLMVAVPSSHPQSQQTNEVRTQEMPEAMRRQQEQWREQMEKMARFQEQQMARFQEQAKRDGRRSLDEAQRQAIGATPSQWRTIRPRLQAVEALRFDAYACLRPQVRLHTSQSVAQCQWTWENIFALDPDKPLTAAETTCRVLRDMLADDQAPSETIWEQVELLRTEETRCRADARRRAGAAQRRDPPPGSRVDGHGLPAMMDAD